jgi:hypothetical protein
MIWAEDAQLDICQWSEDASADHDVDLVTLVAAQAERWTEHVVGEDLCGPPCAREKCLRYWQEGIDVEEMTFFIDPAEADVAPLVTAGWLLRETETRDIYRLTWPRIERSVGGLRSRSTVMPKRGHLKMSRAPSGRASRVPGRGPRGGLDRVSCRLRRAKARYLRAPSQADLSVVFASVQLDEIWEHLTGQELIEAVVEVFASMPAGVGNVSSSQCWSQRRERRSPRYRIVDRAGVSIECVVKALESSGVRALPLDQSVGADHAYGLRAVDGQTLKSRIGPGHPTRSRLLGNNTKERRL